MIIYVIIMIMVLVPANTGILRNEQKTEDNFYYYETSDGVSNDVTVTKEICNEENEDFYMYIKTDDSDPGEVILIKEEQNIEEQ